jgi:hypothetical protein
MQQKNMQAQQALAHGGQVHAQKLSHAEQQAQHRARQAAMQALQASKDRPKSDKDK